MKVKAIYPGTFDPITNGHTDLVKRAAKLFDEVILAIAYNPNKKPFFELELRVEIAKSVLAEHKNVTVLGFSGLLADLAKEHNAQVLVRGVRAVSDFEFDFQLASMNRRLNKGLETVFLTPAENNSFISSSLVKDVAIHGGDVSEFVDPIVVTALKEKLAK